MTNRHPLDIWLSERGRTRDWIVQEIGITKGSLSRIINGKQWGSREFFHRLAQATEGAITPDQFLHPREVESLAHLHASEKLPCG
jgi:transcriptional regulator with XRE-family HTH domain